MGAVVINDSKDGITPAGVRDLSTDPLEVGDASVAVLSIVDSTSRSGDSGARYGIGNPDVLIL